MTLNAGDTIVLKGGRGERKKYNEKRALVMEIPTDGSWMTVQPIPKGTSVASETAETMSWPKKGVKEVKHDPFVMLNDKVCLKIFEFLCDKPETFAYEGLKAGLTNCLGVRATAGRLHARLRSVGPVWKSLFDSIPWSKECIGLPAMQVDLTDAKSMLSLCMMKTMVLPHKVRLGAIVVRNCDLGEIPALVELVEACPTEGVELLYLDISREACPAESLDLRPGTTSGQLPALKGVALSLAQQILHDSIAEQCPRLGTLYVTMTLPRATPVYTNYISEALFSLRSIENLFLSVGYEDPEDRAGMMDTPHPFNTPPSAPSLRIEGRLFSNLVQNLPNLVQLHLTSTKQSDIFKNRRYHIQSKTLRVLDVSCLCSGTVVSFDCPKLELFKCIGGPDGNGLLPRLPRHAFEELMIMTRSRSYQEGPHSSLDVVGAKYFGYVCKGAEGWVASFGEFHRWYELKGDRSAVYEVYRKRCHEMENAIYQTFHDDGELNESDSTVDSSGKRKKENGIHPMMPAWYDTPRPRRPPRFIS